MLSMEIRVTEPSNTVTLACYGTFCRVNFGGVSRRRDDFECGLLISVYSQCVQGILCTDGGVVALVWQRSGIKNQCFMFRRRTCQIKRR